MTASPTATVTSPPKLANFNGDAGGNTLAALFAAAAASSMQRQKASPQQKTMLVPKRSSPQIKSTTTPETSMTKVHKHKSNGTTEAATQGSPLASSKVATPSTKTKVTTKTVNNESEISAANLIASLLNGTTKTSLSSPRFASASSLPQTKTTATFTTTFALKTQPPQQQQNKPSASPMKATTTATTAKHKSTSILHPLQKQAAAFDKMSGNVELRNLESWHDEDEIQMDEDYYQELVDSANTNGWSADEMFKYNEKRHKIMSSYSEKTLSDKYTTPLSQNKSKTTTRMASKLAKEIEDRVVAEGRVTPESSDDDELFEKERRQRMQLKKLKQLDQMKAIKSSSAQKETGVQQSQNRHAITVNQLMDNRPPNNDFSVISCTRRSNKSSSQHSNSSATAATASLSSSPTMNDTNNIIMKSLASSSRNILRTCLT